MRRWFQDAATLEALPTGKKLSLSREQNVLLNGGLNHWLTLTSAEVEASELEDWKRTITESQSGDRELTESRLEGFAHVEAVRSEVRSGLAEAGFPDAPTRLIEVYSDVKCS